MPMGIFSVGDRVTCDFHHGIPATVTALVGDGFKYVLDRPHDLGPRHGFITDGTAFLTDGWRHKNHWEHCDHCGVQVLICGTCLNNCCNGGHGEVDGMPCPDCDSAYREQAKRFTKEQP